MTLNLSKEAARTISNPMQIGVQVDDTFIVQFDAKG